MPRIRTIGLVALLIAALLDVVAAAQPATEWGAPLRLPPTVEVQQGPEASPVNADVIDGVPLLLDAAEQPQWTFRAGSIFLWRSRPSSQALLYDWWVSSEPVVNANQFNFGMQAGPDIGARWQGDRIGVDFRYFGVEDMSASTAAASEYDMWQLGAFPPLATGYSSYSLLFSSSRGIPAPIPDYEFNFNYRSSLQSVEANLRHRVHENVDLLAGFRYLSLRDELAVTYNPRSDLDLDVTYHSIGTNRLAGAQFGLDANILQTNRWRVSGVAKAGIFGNAAAATGRYDGYSSSQYYTLGRALTSCVGEIGATSDITLSRRWSVGIGCQALWLTAMALGSDQFATIRYRRTDGARVADGDVFFLGLTANLQASW